MEKPAKNRLFLTFLTVLKSLANYLLYLPRSLKENFKQITKLLTKIIKK